MTIAMIILQRVWTSADLSCACVMLDTLELEHLGHAQVRAALLFVTEDFDPVNTCEVIPFLIFIFMSFLLALVQIGSCTKIYALCGLL